jgi:hypothetical protein
MGKELNGREKDIKDDNEQEEQKTKVQQNFLKTQCTKQTFV